MERFDEVYNNIDMQDEESTKEFIIEDAKMADWAIGKIADERKRTEYYINVAKAEIDALKEKIANAEKKCENSTQFLIGKLGEFLEREDVPKKKTKTQLSVSLPAGKIVKKLPKTEYFMANGNEVVKSKDNEDFINEIRSINNDLIKTKEEVDWSTLKKSLATDDEGNVYIKNTGEYVESLIASKSLPSIEIKTE